MGDAAVTVSGEGSERGARPSGPGRSGHAGAAGPVLAAGGPGRRPGAGVARSGGERAAGRGGGRSEWCPHPLAAAPEAVGLRVTPGARRACPGAA